MITELIITVVLRASIYHTDSQELIGKWINQVQLGDPLFRQPHYDRGFKGFVFSNLHPTEENGIYKSGEVYVFVIRSSQLDILERIKTCIENYTKKDYFQFVSCERKDDSLHEITEMITITPAIITVNQYPWICGGNIQSLIKQLHISTENKFKHLYPLEPTIVFQPFIKTIQVENQKPELTSYKGRKMLGNKFKLFINNDNYSQKLASVVFTAGLGDKCASLGAGFCLAK